MGAANNYERRKYARAALSDFQNAAIQKYGKDHSISFDLLVNQFEFQYPRGMSEIGDVVSDSRLGLRRLSEAMERAVVDHGYKANAIPSPFMLIQGITDELESWDFSIFEQAAIGIGRDAEQGSKKIVENVGEGLVGASELVSYSKYLIPLAVVGAFLFFARKVPGLD